MGLMSSKIGREELRPGDHIYTWRSGYTYSHHGIYVGDGKVIHLTRGPGLIISSSSRSQPSNEDPVVCCNIENFLCDGQLYRFKYGVTGVVLLIKRAGTCCLAYSNPPEQVLHRASYLLDHGFGNYDLLGKNCEDFALYCKTGIVKDDKTGGGISGQFISLLAALSAVILIPYKFMPATIIGVALVVCGMYCYIRLLLDVGSKMSDYDVVAVEELVHLSRAHNVTAENMMENNTTRCATENMMENNTTRCATEKMMENNTTRCATENMMENSTTRCATENMMENSTTRCATENMNMMENNTTRCALRDSLFISYTFWAIRYWYWTPKIKILVWLKSVILYAYLSRLVSSHLRLYGFKIGEYSVYTIYVLGYWYWRWRSVLGTILLWTRLCFLLSFLFSLTDDGRPRCLKLKAYIFNTIWVLELWHWTPGSTILQWIKLALVYCLLFYFVPDHLRNHRLMCRAIFVCFVIQLTVLVLGLDYSDYIFRIKKITTLL